MERLERYDPEDLESLLHERSYDELLAEERAYVLRHLSGEEEYESMRSLLLNLRRSEQDRATISSDATLRDNVMTAFRESHGPQWKIWLNSLGELIAPQGSSFSWRPVLVIGTMALLITAGVLVFDRTGSSDNNHVAELKRTTKTLPQSRTDGSPTEPELMHEEPVSPLMEESGSMTATADAEEAEQALKVTRTLEESEPTASEMQLDMANMDESIIDQRLSENEIARSENSYSSAAPAMIHTVEEVEAVTRELSAVKKEKLADRSQYAAGSAMEKDLNAGLSGRTLAQDPELIDLMAAGW